MRPTDLVILWLLLALLATSLLLLCALMPPFPVDGAREALREGPRSFRF